MSAIFILGGVGNDDVYFGNMIRALQLRGHFVCFVDIHKTCQKNIPDLLNTFLSNPIKDRHLLICGFSLSTLYIMSRFISLQHIVQKHGFVSRVVLIDVPDPIYVHRNINFLKSSIVSKALDWMQYVCIRNSFIAFLSGKLITLFFDRQCPSLVNQNILVTPNIVEFIQSYNTLSLNLLCFDESKQSCYVITSTDSPFYSYNTHFSKVGFKLHILNLTDGDHHFIYYNTNSLVRVIDEIVFENILDTTVAII